MNEPFVAFGDEIEATIPFAERFVKSEAFRALFREGMGMVEQAAIYLDGEGRTESRDLERMVALAYATESMRLTTRLMQAASSLLLQRAVAEGELSSEQARKEKHRTRLSYQEVATAPEHFEALPQRLRDLIAASMRLHERIRHLDSLMAAPKAEPMPLVANPIASQIDLLRSAFPGQRA